MAGMLGVSVQAKSGVMGLLLNSIDLCDFGSSVAADVP